MNILVAIVYGLMMSRIILDTAKVIDNVKVNNKLLKDIDESIKVCDAAHQQKQLAETILSKCRIQGA